MEPFNNDDIDFPPIPDLPEDEDEDEDEEDSWWEE